MRARTHCGTPARAAHAASPRCPRGHVGRCVSSQARVGRRRRQRLPAALREDHERSGVPERRRQCAQDVRRQFGARWLAERLLLGRVQPNDVLQHERGRRRFAWRTAAVCRCAQPTPEMRACAPQLLAAAWLETADGVRLEAHSRAIACVCVRVRFYVAIRTHARTLTRTLTRTHARSHARTLTRTHARSHARSHTRTLTRARARSHARAHEHAQTHPSPSCRRHSRAWTVARGTEAAALHSRNQ